MNLLIIRLLNKLATLNLDYDSNEDDFAKEVLLTMKSLKIEAETLVKKLDGCKIIVEKKNG